MKRLIFILCLCSSVSIAYGQVKVSLSYQYESSKSISTNKSIENNAPNSDYSGTVQANIIWQFSPYLSVFTGVGHSTKVFRPNTVDYNYDRALSQGIIDCFGQGFGGEVFEEQRFSNIEIPLGFRVNTPSFLNFEMGLSMGVVAATTVNQRETYMDNSYLWSCRSTSNEGEQRTNYSAQRTHYGNRIDVGLDLQYSLGNVWQISLAGTWSPYDWRATDSLSEAATEQENTTTTLVKNGQKGVRLGMVRSF